MKAGSSVYMSFSSRASPLPDNQLEVKKKADRVLVAFMRFREQNSS